jgi:hypothetical protein
MGLQADWLWKSRGCRNKPIRSQTGYMGAAPSSSGVRRAMGTAVSPSGVRQAMGTRNMVLGTNNTPRASIPRAAHRDSLA